MTGGVATQGVERLEAITDDDLAALCEAADAAILDGGGFGWINSPGRTGMQRYYRGVLLVPERELFVARKDGALVGSVQLVRPSRNNEAQAFACNLMHCFIAPYARSIGLGRLLVRALEDHAKSQGYHVLNLDVRETQIAAIALFEKLGFTRWGTHPSYARVAGRTIGGHYYCKALKGPRPEKINGKTGSGPR